MKVAFIGGFVREASREPLDADRRKILLDDRRTIRIAMKLAQLPPLSLEGGGLRTSLLGPLSTDNTTATEIKNYFCFYH